MADEDDKQSPENSLLNDPNVIAQIEREQEEESLLNNPDAMAQAEDAAEEMGINGAPREVDANAIDAEAEARQAERDEIIQNSIEEEDRVQAERDRRVAVSAQEMESTEEILGLYNVDITARQYDENGKKVAEDPSVNLEGLSNYLDALHAELEAKHKQLGEQSFDHPSQLTYYARSQELLEEIEAMRDQARAFLEAMEKLAEQGINVPPGLSQAQYDEFIATLSPEKRAELDETMRKQAREFQEALDKLAEHGINVPPGLSHTEYNQFIDAIPDEKRKELENAGVKIPAFPLEIPQSVPYPTIEDLQAIRRRADDLNPPEPGPERPSYEKKGPTVRQVAGDDEEYNKTRPKNHFAAAVMASAKADDPHDPSKKTREVQQELSKGYESLANAVFDDLVQHADAKWAAKSDEEKKAYREKFVAEFVAKHQQDIAHAAAHPDWAQDRLADLALLQENPQALTKNLRGQMPLSPETLESRASTELLRIQAVRQQAAHSAFMNDPTHRIANDEANRIGGDAMRKVIVEGQQPDDVKKEFAQKYPPQGSTVSDDPAKNRIFDAAALIAQAKRIKVGDFGSKDDPGAGTEQMDASERLMAYTRDKYRFDFAKGADYAEGVAVGTMNEAIDDQLKYHVKGNLGKTLSEAMEKDMAEVNKNATTMEGVKARLAKAEEWAHLSQQVSKHPELRAIAEAALKDGQEDKLALIKELGRLDKDITHFNDQSRANLQQVAVEAFKLAQTLEKGGQLPEGQSAAEFALAEVEKAKDMGAGERRNAVNGLAKQKHAQENLNLIEERLVKVFGKEESAEAKAELAEFRARAQKDPEGALKDATARYDGLWEASTNGKVGELTRLAAEKGGVGHGLEVARSLKDFSTQKFIEAALDAAKNGMDTDGKSPAEYALAQLEAYKGMSPADRETKLAEFKQATKDGYELVKKADKGQDGKISEKEALAYLDKDGDGQMDADITDKQKALFANILKVNGMDFAAVAAKLGGAKDVQVAQGTGMHVEGQAAPTVPGQGPAQAEGRSA